MIALLTDTVGGTWIAAEAARKLGFDELVPVIQKSLRLDGDRIVFEFGKSVCAAKVAPDSGGIKLTLEQITIAGLPVGNIARKPIRKAILGKLHILEQKPDGAPDNWKPPVLSTETPDANILIAVKGFYIVNAVIENGMLDIVANPVA